MTAGIDLASECRLIFNVINLLRRNKKNLTNDGLGGLLMYEKKVLDELQLKSLGIRVKNSYLEKTF